MARSPALVGRHAERARLSEVTADPATAAGRLVLVVGEAGMGKTRLVDEVVATNRSAASVRGRADEHDRAAFGLWLPVLHDLGLPHPSGGAAGPVGEQRWELIDLLVTGLSDAAPVVVVLDDLHWADDDALWVLDQVLDRTVGRAVGVIATSRPGRDARSVRWRAVYQRAEVVPLGGLTVDEVAALAARFRPPAGDPRALWERTGGNPLFVREVVMGGGTGLPTSIDGLLRSSVERLGPDVARLVALVALAGPATPLVVLAAAAALPLDELERRLDVARRADVLRVAADGVRPRHDLLGEAAIGLLPLGRRLDLHQALASAWAGQAAPGSTEHSTRHLLLAVPAVAPEQAAGVALSTAEELTGGSDLAGAIAILRLASAALAASSVAVGTRARVALAEAEATWRLDDYERAVAASEAARDLARAAADPVLVAGAEVVAVTRHHPFRPDPAALERLAAADEALPEHHDRVDPGLRVRLRGRRSVLTRALPGRTVEAVALADDALRRARAAGDPDLLAGAYRDRLFVLVTADDQEARAAAAEELAGLAQRTHRPDLALLAHEWRHATRLWWADLEGAAGALHDLEALAAIMPSPYWRYAAAVRRSALLALLGDYEGALRVAGSSRGVAAGAVADEEATGLEHGLRLTAGLLYGRDDHGADALHHSMTEAVGDAPVLFFQAALALGDAILGDQATARRRLTPWLGRIPRCLEDPEGLGTAGILAHAAVLVGWREAAEPLRTVLAPLAGHMPCSAGATVDVSVDHHLAALALLAGDLDAARSSALDAVLLARRMRSPVLEARALALLSDATERSGDRAAAASARDAARALAEPLAMRLPADDRSTSPAGRRRVDQTPTDRTVTMRLEAGRWSITSPYGTGHVADSIGVRQLVRLVTAPTVEISATDLAVAGRAGVAVTSDLGPALDARAKRQYRQRIAELHTEIDEAEADHDGERASRSRVELDLLLEQLRAAVGLGGRDRPQGSGNERARVNAARTIRRSIAAFRAAIPDLGAHLDVSIRTGHRCTYAPEPAASLGWQIEGPDHRSGDPPARPT